MERAFTLDELAGSWLTAIMGVVRSSEPKTGLVGAMYNQRRRAATVAAAVLAVGLAYHVVFGQNGLTVYEQKRKDAGSLERQVQRLSEENDRLRVHVDRLQSDPGAIEHEAREELHYTRPGEVILTLPNERAATKADDETKQ